MNKKILSLVLIMMLLIGGLVTLTGCGNKNLTADVILEQRSYKVTLTTPATEKTGDDGKKAVVPNYAEESTTKLSTTDCGIIGNKVAIEFEYTSYVYNSYSNYKEKYGNKEPNFENYIEYLEDSEFDKQKSSYQKNAEKTTVAGYTAVKGIYNNNMIYTLKVDGLKENMQFKMTVIPVNENDKIEDLINDSEVSAIISSLKIEEK